MKIDDDQISRWTNPWSQNEEEKADSTSEMVRLAIQNHKILKNLPINVYPKGSYKNNTNVRGDSDIDIAVEYTGMVELEYANDEITFKDTKFDPYDGISKYEVKDMIQDALVAEFGSHQVLKPGKKIFEIRGSDRIHNADIIPCTTYRYYYSKLPNGFHEGIELIIDSPDGIHHANYPEQHHKNGTAKNLDSSRRYKNIVRILKNANQHLTPEGNNPIYRSFMIESLAYNIKTSTYLSSDNWRDIILKLCEEAWPYVSATEPIEDGLRWTEVNGIKYLFHYLQKWTRDDAKNFVLDMYNLFTK